MLSWLWCYSGKQTLPILKEAMQYKIKYKYIVFLCTVYNPTTWNYDTFILIYFNRTMGIAISSTVCIVSANPCQYSFTKHFHSHSNGINHVFHLSFRTPSIPFLSEVLWIVSNNKRYSRNIYCYLGECIAVRFISAQDDPLNIWKAPILLDMGLTLSKVISLLLP